MENINPFRKKTLSADQIDLLEKCVKGSWFFNPSNGKVDIKGDFITKNLDLVSLEGINFGEVTGDFNISANNLSSLEGSPRKIGGSFRASDNSLKYLDDGPEEVGWSYMVDGNSLVSLRGVPNKIPGNFDCSYNYLKSLRGGPKEVDIHYGAIQNPLKSLEGAPEKVDGYFQIDDVIFNQPWGLSVSLDALNRYEDDKRVGLIRTLPFLHPDYINRELKKSPEETIMYLKSAWNTQNFSPIKQHIEVPEKYKKELDVLSDLNSLGF
jgi:hypothetical protein